MKVIERMIGYFSYVLKSKTRFGVHSPFVFDLICTVTPDRKVHAEKLKAIEKARKNLLSDRSTILRTDLGSGSGKEPVATTVRRIAARHAIRRLVLAHRIYMKEILLRRS
jgi:hypothetical protein